MMSGRGYSSKEPVKVVIISTQYVQTDAGSFKSVVQKLTGKDSQDQNQGEQEAPASRNAKGLKTKARSHEASGGGSSFLMRDVSFKDFDRLLREMPPIHEIWSDYQ